MTWTPHEPGGKKSVMKGNTGKQTEGMTIIVCSLQYKKISECNKELHMYMYWNNINPLITVLEVSQAGVYGESVLPKSSRIQWVKANVYFW